MKPPAPVRAVSRVTGRVASRVTGRVAARVGASKTAQRIGQRFFRGDAVSAPPGYDIRRIDPSVVNISYDPDPDGKPDPGEVVWLWIPYDEDPTIGKDRPAVAIGWTEDRRLAVVPLTSKFRAGSVSVGVGSWDGGRRRSYAKVGYLFSVQRDFVRREGSSLPKPSFDQVIATLR